MEVGRFRIGMDHAAAYPLVLEGYHALCAIVRATIAHTLELPKRGVGACRAVVHNLYPGDS